MDKQSRREQLLDVALEIITSEGTEALTLGYLALKANVSKPITYNHFQSKENLLYSLYKYYDEKIIDSIKKNINKDNEIKGLDDVVLTISKEYLECVKNYGIQYELIISALIAFPQYKNLRSEIRLYFTNCLLEILSPYSKIPQEQFFYTCMAIWSAMENFSLFYLENSWNEEKIIENLIDIIINILKFRSI